MPVQTRAKAPTDRVYSSPAAQQQVRFRPGKQNITYRRSLGASHRSRQQTLTQIDFVNLQDAFDQDSDKYINYEESEQNKRRKRRRTYGDMPSSSSNFHTQTLTQLEFVSTPALRFVESIEMENNFDDDSTVLKHETDISPSGQMGPPKTPSRRKIYEVPSSQSPFTPISARSQKFLNTRSPLKPLDNLQTQSLSPVRNSLFDKSPKLEMKIEDTFDYENESQESRVPQTPGYRSNPTRSASSSVQSRIRTATQRLLRDEIRDSDEEDDDDIESCYDAKVRESQVELYCKREHSSQITTLKASNNSPSDTQEADNQLQNTILQFTQHIPYAGAAAEDDEGQNYHPFIRPSQATTVSQSQPATSSPIFLRRPNEYLQFQEDTFPNVQDGGQEQNNVGEEEGLHVMAIPDSPSQLPASSSSWHSSRIRRPRDDQHHRASFKAGQNHQQQKHVPTSTSYFSSSPPIRMTRPRPIISSPSATKAPHSDAANQVENQSTLSPLPQPFFLLPSSQILMTRSQMLPDSLMNASVPPPPKLPFFIEDSETEEDF